MPRPYPSADRMRFQVLKVFQNITQPLHKIQRLLLDFPGRNLGVEVATISGPLSSVILPACHKDCHSIISAMLESFKWGRQRAKCAGIHAMTSRHSGQATKVRVSMSESSCVCRVRSGLSYGAVVIPIVGGLIWRWGT